MIVDRTTRVPFAPEAVWAWHMRPGAFERLTPPWARVRVLSRTGGIENGARVTLEVMSGPIPLRWVAEHREVVEGRQFADVQLEGPFARWNHLHAFEPDGAGGCVLRDWIECELPAGAIGALVGGGHVRHELEAMLRYRHDTLHADLTAHRDVTARTFVVSGATGLVGSALVPFLTTGGHRVLRLVRGATTPGRQDAGAALHNVGWDPERGVLPGSELEGADAVIHLAGASIAGARWTVARKQLLLESRVTGTDLLARTIAGLARRPSAFVSVSAVGIYGDRGDDELGDAAATGSGFLADLAVQWEGAAEPARAAGIRTAHPRLGIVLSPAGGALERLLPPFRLGAGGPIGSGRQWMAWASIDDVAGLLYWSALQPEASGAFNAVSPDTVRNAAFAHTLGRVLGRPAFLPVPAAALTLVFGEMAEAALLASQRAVPTLLTRVGYPYRHPTLDHALRHVLGRVA
jgi:uncharacterized protein (TIGR01777 family)